MCKKTDIKILLEDIKISGKIDEKAINRFDADEQRLIRKLYEENAIDESLDLLNSLNLDVEWNFVKEKLVVQEPSTYKKLFPKKYLQYAAILIGFIGVGAYFLNNTHTVPEEIVDVPQEDAIILKVADGNVKVINQNANQQIVSNSGLLIGVQNGNKITYNANSDIDELLYNELKIPNGKIFDLELSDGTVVHLNSGTSIKYPVQFIKGSKREVFIDGEAYFDVFKDQKHPFIVHANEVVVEVLGTSFNVSSYSEDDEIKTVLVEGLVRLTNSYEHEEIILKPGFKAAWDKTSHSTGVEKVDVNLYTSWIKGELVFNNVSFQNITKKLERSYNVTITNNNVLLDDKLLNARFSVNVESIDDVLKSINQIQPFAYKIIDDKVIID